MRSTDVETLVDDYRSKRSPSRHGLGIALIAASIAATCLACPDKRRANEPADGTEVPPLVDISEAGSSTQLQPKDLALDEEYVYVAAAAFTSTSVTGGAIVRVPKTGGAVEPVVQTASSTLGVVTDDTTVYFTDYRGGPWAVAKTGGEPVLVGIDGSVAWAVTLDAEYLYWTTWLAEDSGCIARVKKDGDVDSRKVLASDPGLPLRLVVDVERVYWGNQAGEIWSVPKEGGEKILLAVDSVRNADFLVVDDNYVYFISGGSRVSRVPKLGGDTVVLAAELQWAEGLALKSGRVYVGTDDGIRSFAVDGSAPELLEGTQSVGNSIRSDSHAIYWISDGGGVYRLDQ